MVLAKPTGIALNFRFCPGSIVVPGDMPAIDTLATKLTLIVWLAEALGLPDASVAVIVRV